MNFICSHIFRGYGQTPYFDCAFLEFPPINPKRYVELKSDISRLFETGRDENLKLKKTENNLGLFRRDY